MFSFTHTLGEHNSEANDSLVTGENDEAKEKNWGIIIDKSGLKTIFYIFYFSLAALLVAVRYCCSKDLLIVVCNLVLSLVLLFSHVDDWYRSCR